MGAEHLMTDIAAKFEGMTAVHPGRGSGGRPVVVDEWSVVVSHLGNVLMVCLESVDDREGVRGASGHICRRVQPESRRLEVLHG